MWPSRRGHEKLGWQRATCGGTTARSVGRPAAPLWDTARVTDAPRAWNVCSRAQRPCPRVLHDTSGCQRGAERGCEPREAWGCTPCSCAPATEWGRSGFPRTPLLCTSHRSPRFLGLCDKEVTPGSAVRQSAWAAATPGGGPPRRLRGGRCWEIQPFSTLLPHREPCPLGVLRVFCVTAYAVTEALK